MSSWDSFVDSTGDAAKELLKKRLLELIRDAKDESEDLVKESAEKIEDWLLLKLKGEIDSDELEALLSARKRTLQQFLNTQEIKARARLEKVTVELIDLILDKAIEAIL